MDVPIVKSRLEQCRLEQSRLELGAVICTKLEHLVVACRRNKPSSERRSSTLAAVVCAIDSRFAEMRRLADGMRPPRATCHDVQTKGRKVVVNARRNDVTQNPLEAPGSDHRSGEALARPIGRVVRFLVAPALAIMNRMNYVLKFLLVGLLLLLPFAYVTHLMVEASKKQSSFNQKESYGVEYVAAALDLLGTVEDARVVSSAIVAGDSSLAADLARDDDPPRFDRGLRVGALR